MEATTAAEIRRPEVFAPELHSFVYRAIFEIADAVHGAARVDALLRPYGISRAQLLDKESWVSLAFTEAFLDDLYREADDPQLYAKVARLSMSPRYLGPRHAFIRAFGTPMLAYTLIAKTAATMNKTGSYIVQRTTATSCVLTFTPTPGIGPERTPYMCEIRRVMIAGFPGIFDLPDATVGHPQCVARGDAVCRYELAWQPSSGREPLWIGSGIGTALAVGYTYWTDLQLLPAAVAVLAFGTAGWAFGRATRLRGDLTRRMEDVREQQDALESSLRINEERFAQVLEAKAEVERKVDVRTQELRETSSQLADTLSKIEALDRAKTDFFNNVSHELRSPLTMILAPLEELVAGRTPPGGTASALRAMHRNAARLLRLINQLLDLAKIDASETAIHPVLTDVGAFLQLLCSSFEPAAQGKGLALELHVESHLAPIAVDPAWIESAVTNLIANAMRVTPPGKGVRVSVHDHGSEITIAIADDGPGIARVDQERIFERFAQGDSSKRIVGGTGIGLALVREAARLHGGDVQLSSELGKGATFSLRLPRRLVVAGEGQPSSPVARTWRPAPIWVDDAGPSSELSRLDGPNENCALAFVVEDNTELRNFIAAVLAVRYRVRAFSDGREAARFAETMTPDVVVSDVAMPEMNGYELCRELRKRSTTESVPIVLVTARTDVASVLEGFDAGASDYVLKPFHGRELLARVDVHVRLRRMIHELALRERHAMLGELSAAVAHQVRNPLTTLVSGLPAIRAKLKDVITPSSIELIGVMIDCAERIERLTADLMELSRVDRETSGVFRPSDGLHSAIRLIQSKMLHGIAIDDRVQDSPSIEGKAGDLNHAFMNILDNAVRAVGASGRIQVEAETEGNAYVIRIGDSGPGISEEEATKIFEPFYTTRQAGEGTGLGLAIALRVVRQSGGNIVVARSHLGGAEFVIRIPIVATQPARAPGNLSPGGSDEADQAEQRAGSHAPARPST